ncbi:DUF1146 family protein [Mammaliicoccus stepanovicii]|uniref:Membrane protein n=1 Tax=Mammaliicoccus stepanovicii TaxID=643214 RepID=A0A239YNU8_9STAP|nr:DUF1146 family protein [Mammaliicoccus stepanovicii]PNZ78930.1 DUF1146 domain-containing protein [Mammaliicoccus stepanovicii]GGI41259.1 membrane protein [Mammaliicoccus stepanovicii]SNV60457.1 membrane protein [Mammaliicoccus stepanovicii]
MEYYGQVAIVGLVLHIICICLAFWALQSLRLDGVFKKHHVAQAQTLILILAVLLGTALSRFILDILQFSLQLKLLF